jgi:hypothetical protein
LGDQHIATCAWSRMNARFRILDNAHRRVMGF